MGSWKIGKIVVIALAMVSISFAGAFSLPGDWEVENGNVNIDVRDNQMIINADNPTTIINFNSFNIQENESVLVNLPTADSRILTRDISGSQSELLGMLSCNGIFALINTSGIHVGQNADINAGSLILSTRDINSADFINGDFVFNKLSADQLDMLLLNEGNITISEGGFGVLIAGGIDNKGKIIAPAGRIVLAGCSAIALRLSNDGLISVAIAEEAASKILDHEGNPITDQISNTGTIEADGGQVILHAESLQDVFEAAINMKGIIKSRKMDISGAGLVKMTANEDIELAGEIEADRIEIEASRESDVRIASQITASSIDVRAEGAIEVNTSVIMSGGDIVLYADYNSNGAGAFTQNAELIATTGTGDITIDGAGIMTLRTIKTELGSIKIGTNVAPTAIIGEPRYVHTAGDIVVRHCEGAKRPKQSRFLRRLAGMF